jgi:hypothetical protein
VDTVIASSGHPALFETHCLPRDEAQRGRLCLLQSRAFQLSAAVAGAPRVNGILQTYFLQNASYRTIHARTGLSLYQRRRPAQANGTKRPRKKTRAAEPGAGGAHRSPPPPHRLLTGPSATRIRGCANSPRSSRRPHGVCARPLRRASRRLSAPFRPGRGAPLWPSCVPSRTPRR